MVDGIGLNKMNMPSSEGIKRPLVRDLRSGPQTFLREFFSISQYIATQPSSPPPPPCPGNLDTDWERNCVQNHCHMVCAVILNFNFTLASHGKFLKYIYRCLGPQKSEEIRALGVRSGQGFCFIFLKIRR